MAVFALIIFILMVMSAGIAIDTMRHEERRAELQNVLDRAVLAAASLTQTGDPEEVVIDYVDAAGFNTSDVDVDVYEETSGGITALRRVTAQSDFPLDSLFVQILGIDDMSVGARSKAEDQITDLEVVLVLDVSGSMSTGSRMTNLKDASDKFVDLLVDNAAADLTMSIVPYHSMVNIGSALDGPFNLDTRHDLSTCARFGAMYYDRTDLPLEADPSFGTARTTIERVAHFDRHSDSNNPKAELPRAECESGDARAIVAWTKDPAVLKARIDTLYPAGGTAIHLGMKWAGLLIDPWSRPILNSLVVAGDTIPDGMVHSDHQDRPYEHGAAGVRKIIVLMTDGINDEERDLTFAWKGAVGSGVFVHHATWPGDGYSASIDGGDDFGKQGTPQYSIRYDATGQYWNPATDSWNASPVGGALARELTYEQLFARMPSKYIADHNDMLRDVGGSDHALRKHYRKPHENLEEPIIDPLYASICTKLKEAGVIVYTVGFESPLASANALRTCASSDSHYYTAVGAELEDRFANIARSIAKLGLRQ